MKVKKIRQRQQQQVRFLTNNGSNKCLPSIFEGLERQESFREILENVMLSR